MILLWILSIYLTIHLIILVLTWNYFKNFKHVVKNIELFKSNKIEDSDNLQFIFTLNNYIYTIVYDIDSQDIKLLFKCGKNGSHHEGNVVSFYTNLITFILMPTYVSYYWYIKRKLELN